MKSKITLLFILFYSVVSFAQDKQYDQLRNKTKTNILYDRVFGVSNATEIRKAPITSGYFNQAFHEIQRADFTQSLPKYEVLKEEAKSAFVTNQIPLAILVSDFETIKKSALENGDVFLNNNNQMSLKSNTDVFDKHSISIMAPLVSKSNAATFILKDNFAFNTTNNSITSIYIKVNNATNWIKINYNQAFQLQFNEIGKQIVNYKIVFANSAVSEQSFEIEIQTKNTVQTNKNEIAPLSPNVVNSITSTIPFQGYGETALYNGIGEYEVFLDTTNGILDKPIFLLDGFDPGDTRNTATIYNLLNYGTGQNLATDLRAQGFDVIILNFPNYTRPSTTTVIDGGADYIQRNAMIFVELLNQINAQKVGTEKNVVIGPSMGGLIARYALRYMEMNNLNPDTRLYISFDSPHLGANVPIGFQHLFNYMAYGPAAITAVQPIVDGLLKSAAAREMLIDQFEGHLQSGSAFEFTTASASLLPNGCPNYRTAFQNELNTMGFPVTVRNVSITNGAGNGAMNYSPDFEVMNHTFNITTSQRAIINLRFTPATNVTNQVSRFRGQGLLFGFWITAYESLANSKAPTFTNGLDSSPGGRFDMAGLQAGLGTDPLLLEFFANLNANYFTFIPTWSSMAISNTNNLYTPITGTSVTPFAASSIPTVNENHVTLNAQNIAFALSEILNPVLTNNDTVALNSVWIQNPIENSIQINSSYTIENATISVTDVLGKTIFSSTNQTLTGSLEIPISLSKGIYLITIANEKGSVTKKLVKG
jgi:pimeloyl-ACP methyl ester carboxylesterase